MFSTIEAAIDYIQGKLADFYNRRFEIQELYLTAQANLREAYAQGRFIDEARKSFDETIVMLNDYYDLSDRLKPLASAFEVETGLGLFPAVVVTAIWYLGGVAATITVAELLWGYYQRLDTQRVIIKAVKDGLLPANALTKPPATGPIQSMLDSLTMLALIVGGGYLLIKKG
jgi:hypothetical protein